MFYQLFVVAIFHTWKVLSAHREIRRPATQDDLNTTVVVLSQNVNNKHYCVCVRAKLTGRVIGWLRAVHDRQQA